MNLVLPIKRRIDIKPKNIKGLGDIIALVAEPVKHIIIKHGPEIIASKLRNCNCNKRKAFLNKILPL